MGDFAFLKKSPDRDFCEKIHLQVEGRRATGDLQVVRFSKTDGKKGAIVPFRAPFAGRDGRRAGFAAPKWVLSLLHKYIFMLLYIYAYHSGHTG
jgi:hypothetical protein